VREYRTLNETFNKTFTETTNKTVNVGAKSAMHGESSSDEVMQFYSMLQCDAGKGTANGNSINF
jgi:hypothetical protein